MCLVVIKWPFRITLVFFPLIQHIRSLISTWHQVNNSSKMCPLSPSYLPGDKRITRGERRIKLAKVREKREFQGIVRVNSRWSDCVVRSNSNLSTFVGNGSGGSLVGDLRCYNQNPEIEANSILGV